jgi:hypothetical protein
MPVSTARTEAGVVDSPPPGESSNQSFSIANGFATGGQINIKKAIHESDEL